MKLYHGTTLDKAESILKNGLNKNSFVSSIKKNAFRYILYSRYNVSMKKYYAVLLVFDISKNKISKYFKKQDQGDWILKTNWYAFKKIPKEYIRGYELYSIKHTKAFSRESDIVVIREKKVDF